MRTAVAFVYGAGLEQVPAIREAHSLGVRVIACGGDSMVPAMLAADATHVVDLDDAPAVIKALAETPPDIVLPTPYGPYVRTAGAVIDAFMIPGAGSRVSGACHDKRAFHHVLERVGLPSPRQYVATTGRQIRSAIRRIGLPCILKPRDGVGSRAVSVIGSEADVARCISWHLAERYAHGHQETVVEEYISGTEYAINMVVGDDGRAVFAQIHTKEASPPPLRHEFGKHVDPATDKGTLTGMQDAVTLVAQHLGIRSSPVNADIIVTPDERVYIVDYTPRFGGPMLAPVLVPAASGVNVTRETIRLLSGLPADFTRTADNAVVLRYYPRAESGLVVTDPDVRRAASIPGVVHVSCRLRAGMRLTGWASTAELRARALIVTAGATLADAEVAWLDATAALGLRIAEDVASVDAMAEMA
jgi:cysteine synthase A